MFFKGGFPPTIIIWFFSWEIFAGMSRRKCSGKTGSISDRSRRRQESTAHPPRRRKGVNLYRRSRLGGRAFLARLQGDPFSDGRGPSWHVTSTFQHPNVSDHGQERLWASASFGGKGTSFASIRVRFWFQFFWLTAIIDEVLDGGFIKSTVSVCVCRFVSVCVSFVFWDCCHRPVDGGRLMAEHFTSNCQLDLRFLGGFALNLDEMVFNVFSLSLVSLVFLLNNHKSSQFVIYRMFCVSSSSS